VISETQISKCERLLLDAFVFSRHGDTTRHGILPPLFSAGKPFSISVAPPVSLAMLLFSTLDIGFFLRSRGSGPWFEAAAMRSPAE